MNKLRLSIVVAVALLLLAVSGLFLWRMGAEKDFDIYNNSFMVVVEGVDGENQPLYNDHFFIRTTRSKAVISFSPQGWAQDSGYDCETGKDIILDSDGVYFSLEEKSQIDFNTYFRGLQLFFLPYIGFEFIETLPDGFVFIPYEVLQGMGIGVERFKDGGSEAVVSFEDLVTGLLKSPQLYLGHGFSRQGFFKRLSKAGVLQRDVGESITELFWVEQLDWAEAEIELPEQARDYVDVISELNLENNERLDDYLLALYKEEIPVLYEHLLKAKELGYTVTGQDHDPQTDEIEIYMHVDFGQINENVEHSFNGIRYIVSHGQVLEIEITDMFVHKNDFSFLEVVQELVHDLATDFFEIGFDAQAVRETVLARGDLNLNCEDGLYLMQMEYVHDKLEQAKEDPENNVDPDLFVSKCIVSIRKAG